jgi:hypothetical protein
MEREVAQAGSALGLGPRGRRFESCLPDKKVSSKTLTFFYAPISTGHAVGIKHEKFENTS